MSLEQQVAALVAASNDLTEVVASKQAAIDARVATKIAELEAWKAGAKDQFISAEAKTIVVAGDADKWYPVCFPSARDFGFLHIKRFVHSEEGTLGAFNGGLNVQLHATNTGYAGRPPVLFFDYYAFNGNLFNSTTPPIGKVDLTQNSDNIVIWLLGGNRSYSYVLPNANDSAYIPSAAVDSPSHRLGGGAVPGVITAVDTATTKPNNYVRGGV